MSNKQTVVCHFFTHLYKAKDHPSKKDMLLGRRWQSKRILLFGIVVILGCVLLISSNFRRSSFQQQQLVEQQRRQEDTQQLVCSNNSRKIHACFLKNVCLNDRGQVILSHPNNSARVQKMLQETNLLATTLTTKDPEGKYNGTAVLIVDDENEMECSMGGAVHLFKHLWQEETKVQKVQNIIGSRPNCPWLEPFVTHQYFSRNTITPLGICFERLYLHSGKENDRRERLFFDTQQEAHFFRLLFWDWARQQQQQPQQQRQLMLIPPSLSSPIRKMLQAQFESYQIMEFPPNNNDDSLLSPERISVLAQTRVVLLPRTQSADTLAVSETITDNDLWFLPKGALVCVGGTITQSDADAGIMGPPPHVKYKPSCSLLDSNLLRAQLTMAISEMEFEQQPCVDEWCIH